MSARLAAALALAIVALVGTAAGAESAPASQAATHPVVVELFTSQGCSTCPPADALLSALGERDAGRVIPLAFHVDSWNHDGWTDPFSSAEWTRRHGFYARKLGAQGAYTPQAVVDGAAELLGSDPAAMSAAIAAAALRPAATLRLELRVSDPGRVEAEVEGELPEGLRDAKLELLFAVVETGLVTPVKRGENGGRTLRNDHVVRSMEKARLEPGADGRFRTAASLKLAASWAPKNLAVVAFVQEPRTLAIRGADSRRLAPS